MAVQTIQSKHREERLALEWTFRQVRQGSTHSVVSVEYVETEAFGPYIPHASTEAIDIAHHQRPSGSYGSHIRPFEELDEEDGRGCVGAIRGEFAHPIHLALVGELIGYGEDFIRGKGGGEADVPEGTIQGIVGGG